MGISAVLLNDTTPRPAMVVIAPAPPPKEIARVAAHRDSVREPAGRLDQGTIEVRERAGDVEVNRPLGLGG